MRKILILVVALSSGLTAFAEDKDLQPTLSCKIANTLPEASSIPQVSNLASINLKLNVMDLTGLPLPAEPLAQEAKVPPVKLHLQKLSKTGEPEEVPIESRVIGGDVSKGFDVSFQIPLAREEIGEFVDKMIEKGRAEQKMGEKLAADAKQKREQMIDIFQKKLLQNQVGQFQLSCEYLIDGVSVRSSPIVFEVVSKGGWRDKFPKDK